MKLSGEGFIVDFAIFSLHFFTWSLQFSSASIAEALYMQLTILESFFDMRKIYPSGLNNIMYRFTCDALEGKSENDRVE